MFANHSIYALASIALATFAACKTADPIGKADPRAATFLRRVETAPVLTVGSLIYVTGDDLPSGDDVVLVIGNDEVTSNLHTAPGAAAGELLFSVSRDAIAAMGEGPSRLTAQVRSDEGDSNTLTFDAELDLQLTPVLNDAPTGVLHFNDEVILHGDGLLLATEGTSELRLQGVYAKDGGDTETVSLSLPVTIASRSNRSVGAVTIPSALGAPSPGSFTGTVTLVTETIEGAEQATTPLEVAFEVGEPELIAIDPPAASFGQYVNFNGAGFLGAENNESTRVILTGTFTDSNGKVAPVDLTLAPEFISGTVARWVPLASVERNQLVSTDFGAPRGTFVGSAVIKVTRGVEEVTGNRLPVTFELEKVRQVGLVVFLPGFYSALERFGLRNMAEDITAAAIDRMRRIYAGYRVDFRAQTPEDYAPGWYATVEVGGSDPNAAGNFGYDNTPGKDINNLRLADEIGGVNAETQRDGSPGYGGVFIESFLFFSSHPDLPYPVPAVPSDPLFDEIFDPTRREPVTAAEALGDEGDEERQAAIHRAARALASMVGETTSHEFGHSLGMAQPYGSLTAFHSSFDGDGCIMDPGGNRTVGERTEQEGFPVTRFCGDEVRYMAEILGND